MMVMVDSTCPGTKIDEAATNFLESMKNNPPPEYVKLIDLYAVAGGDGFTVITFFDVEKGKEDEGLKYINRGEVDQLRTIEGYKAEVQVVYNMAEAFEFLGMNAPAV